MNKIEIKISAKKMAISLVSLLLLTIISVISFFYAEELSKSPNNSTDALLLKLMAVFIFIIMAFIFKNITKKIFKKNLSLTIDDDKITDNTENFTFNSVKWEDITEVKKLNSFPIKAILFYTKDPQFFINKEVGRKRKILEAYTKKYGTPLVLFTNSLNYNYDELYTIIESKIKKIN